MTPTTTNRFYRVNTYRGANWTGPPTGSLGSNECRGAISTPAGNGTAGFLGDGGAATSARLNGPRGLAYAPSGDLYIADTANNRIRRVTPAGTISTFAGGPAASACTYTGPVAGLGSQRPLRRRRRRLGERLHRRHRRGLHPQGRHRRQRHPCRGRRRHDDLQLDRRGDRGEPADTPRHRCRQRRAPCTSPTAAATACARSSAPPTASSPVAGPRPPATRPVRRRRSRCRRRTTSRWTARAPSTSSTPAAAACARWSASTYSHVLGGGATTTCASTGAATAVALSVPEGIALDASGRVLVTESTRRCVRAVTGTNYSHVALTGTNSTRGRQRTSGGRHDVHPERDRRRRRRRRPGHGPFGRRWRLRGPFHRRPLAALSPSRRARRRSAGLMLGARPPMEDDEHHDRAVLRRRPGSAGRTAATRHARPRSGRASWSSPTRPGSSCSAAGSSRSVARFPWMGPVGPPVTVDLQVTTPTGGPSVG